MPGEAHPKDEMPTLARDIQVNNIKWSRLEETMLFPNV